MTNGSAIAPSTNAEAFQASPNKNATDTAINTLKLKNSNMNMTNSTISPISAAKSNLTHPVTNATGMNANTNATNFTNSSSISLPISSTIRNNSQNPKPRRKVPLSKIKKFCPEVA